MSSFVERRFHLSLWGILALGIVVSTGIAAVTSGEPFDMQSFALVRDALDGGAFSVYSHFAHIGVDRWPYPPGFFPWIWLSGKIAAAGGPSFQFMLRVPVILADAAIAWLVQDFLGAAGRSQQTRLLAAGLVSLGPSFVVIAGYHGQFDAVAILPGVLALSLWCRPENPSRAIQAGLLIGLGAALKTVPLLLVLALLPTARSRREGLGLLLACAAPMILSLLPFAIAGTLPSAHVLAYRGLPGVGDLSLVVQPNLAVDALGISFRGFSGASHALIHHGSLVTVLGLLAVAAVGAKSRAPAPQMAALLWLAVYAFGVNFFFQYLVWGLPFLLMAGYVRAVLIAQLLVLPPTLMFYLRPLHHTIFAVLYALVMIPLWAAALGAFVTLARQLIRGRTLSGETRVGQSAAA